MPDIEKVLRLRADRSGIVIFSEARNIEEILIADYTQTLKCRRTNPSDFNRPESSKALIDNYMSFITDTLGREVAARINIIIDDAAAVAERIQRGREDVKNYRLQTDDAYYFN